LFHPFELWFWRSFAESAGLRADGKLAKPLTRLILCFAGKYSIRPYAVQKKVGFWQQRGANCRGGATT
jgi:hypothetical protein